MISVSKERKIGTIISWSTIVIEVLISLFFTPFFLKTVGDKEYGLYSFSSSLISWVNTLVIAIASAFYRFLTIEKKKAGDYGEARACGTFFKIFFVVAISISIFGLLFDFLINFNVIKLSEYSSSEIAKIVLIILMSVLSTAFTSLITVSKSYVYYKQKYIFAYTISLMQIILQTLVSFIFLKIGFGVIFVAIAHFGVAFLLSIFQVFYSHKILKLHVAIKNADNGDKEYRLNLTKEILVFSSFIILNTVVDILNRNLDTILLGFYNADSVATYHLALSIPNYLISFTSIISVVYTQRINEVYFEDNGIEKVNTLFLKVSKIQTCLTLLLVGGFLSCGKEFVFMWLDPNRVEVYIVASVLMILYSLTCSNGLAIVARRAQDKHKKASVIYFSIAVLNIVLSIIFLEIFDKSLAIFACLSGTVITYLCGQWIVMQIYDKKEASIQTGAFFKMFFPRFIFTICISLAISFLPDLFINVQNNFLVFVIKGFTFVVLYIMFEFFVDGRQLLNFFKNEFIFKKKENL